VLVGPFLRHVVRAVAGPRREVEKEGRVRCTRLLLADPRDRLRGDGFREMPGGVVVRRLDRRGILEERRVPLARLSALESIPVIETFARRPAVEWARGAQLMVGRVVPFPEGGRAVVIAPENLRDAGGFPGPGTFIPREPGRHLGDDARVDGVVVAAREQRGARRRAERG